MKRVIQFIHGLNMGGAETLVKEYSLRLPKDKYEVIVLCYSKMNSPYEKLLEQNGIQIVYMCDNIPTWCRKGLLLKIINHYALYFETKRQLRKLKPDIIHTHLCLNSYIKFSKIPHTVKLVYTQHFDVRGWVENHKNDIKALRYLLCKYNVQIIALSQDMKYSIEKIFDNRYNNQIKILNNGIDLALYNKKMDKNKIRQKISVPEDCFLIGHVGRFNKIKNHKFILQVFIELLTKKKNAHLLLIGDGETRSEIENIAVQHNIRNRINPLPMY